MQAPTGKMLLQPLNGKCLIPGPPLRAVYSQVFLDIVLRKFLNGKIDELRSLAYQQDAEKIKEKLQEIVPEYTISDDEAVV